MPFYPHKCLDFFTHLGGIFVITSNCFMRNKDFEDAHNCVVKNWHLYIYVKIQKSFFQVKKFYKAFSKISISIFIVPKQWGEGWIINLQIKLRKNNLMVAIRMKWRIYSRMDYWVLLKSRDSVDVRPRPIQNVCWFL